MATKVVMEALSPTMEEGRLVEWKKQEGEPVTVGDVLAEVETDKAVMELVARAGGTLLKHIVEAGATVPVSEPVAVIGEPGEDGGEAGKRGGGDGGKRAAAGRQRQAKGRAGPGDAAALRTGISPPPCRRAPPAGSRHRDVAGRALSGTGQRRRRPTVGQPGQGVPSGPANGGGARA